jgi:hypothetical protein
VESKTTSNPRSKKKKKEKNRKPFDSDLSTEPTKNGNPNRKREERLLCLFSYLAFRGQFLKLFFVFVFVFFFFFFFFFFFLVFCIIASTALLCFLNFLLFLRKNSLQFPEAQKSPSLSLSDPDVFCPLKQQKKSSHQL